MVVKIIAGNNYNKTIKMSHCMKVKPPSHDRNKIPQTHSIGDLGVAKLEKENMKTCERPLLFLGEIDHHHL